MQALPTHFATAERLSPEQIQSQSAQFANVPYLRQLVDGLPIIFVVLNNYRQIVFSNRALAKAAARKEPEELYGLRPGEAFHCIHSTETEGGCGTSEFCRTCGAVRAILTAIRGKKDVQECRITTNHGQALDLRATACPLNDGDDFLSFSLEDISHEKRRRALERIFFHDVLNTAGGVKGLAELLVQEDDPQEARELIKMIQTAAAILLEEISAQKSLSAAETGELTVQPSSVDTRSLLTDVAGLYQKLATSKDQRIVLDSDTESIVFTTDETLISRVLANMLKNALEASSAEETIALGARCNQDRIELWVHNPGVMPKKSQLQIFQRSFSTKGKGRGLGAYSIRLLTERYLKGQAAFESTEEDGTTFFVSLPMTLEK